MSYTYRKHIYVYSWTDNLGCCFQQIYIGFYMSYHFQYILSNQFKNKLMFIKKAFAELN